MGRIRTIKPEHSQDEDLSQLPEITHFFSSALLCEADDEGYFNANPQLLKSHIFPLREPSVSIHDMLTQLSNIGYVQLGNAENGKRVGRVVKFAEHQRVNRPTISKIKNLKIEWDNSVRTHGEFIEVSLPEGKGKEKEGKGKECPPVRAELDCSQIRISPPNSEEYVDRVKKAWAFTGDWSPIIEQYLVEAFYDEAAERKGPMSEAAAYVTERLERIATLVKKKDASQWGFYPLASVIKHPKNGKMYRRPDEMWIDKPGGKSYPKAAPIIATQNPVDKLRKELSE